LFVIALLVKKSSVDEDSKQLVKNNLLFPDKNTAYRRCRPNIVLQKLWIAMHGNKHVDMLS